MTFALLALRQNGQKILYSWFNDVKSAGMRLESLIGGPGNIPEQQISITNNQSSPANVTGLLLDHTLTNCAFISYFINRLTTGAGATELTEGGSMLATWDTGAATWRLTADQAGPDDSGVDFTITSAGQVQYTSTSITGTASQSKMRFSANTMGVFT